MTSCDVAIVGGGIAGLTLASSLLRTPMSVRVFEQDTELREIGAGIAIGGNATRLLEDLGLDLAPAANLPPTLELRRWSDGARLWSHPIGEWYRREVGAPFLTFHRATLQRLLAAAVPAECVQPSHRLVGLSDEPAGVRLRFEQGDDVVARVVIGADGVNSVARRYVCEDVQPTYSGEIGFRGVIPTARSRDLPTPESLHIWCGPRTHAVFYGLDRGELVNLLLVYTPERLPTWTRSSTRLSATREEALAIFEGYSWDRRILDLVRNIEGDMSFWALVELPRLTRWSRGRVVLLGDAAHAPLPHQGQGAGQAIEDAYALGALLAGAGPEHHGSAFAAFERHRRPRTRRVQAYSRLAGRAYELTGDAAARRDASWSSLPRRIGWIHGYREEEVVPVSSETEEALMEGVEAFRRRVEASRLELAALPRSGWGELGPPDPETGERWDRSHVLGHLAEMLPFWTAQVRAALAGAADLGRDDQGWARRREGIDGGRGAGLEELLRRVDQGLSGLLGLLGELRDEDLGRAVVYRDGGGRSREVTLRTAMEERLVGHVEAHLRQVAGLG